MPTDRNYDFGRSVATSAQGVLNDLSINQPGHSILMDPKMISFEPMNTKSRICVQNCGIREALFVTEYLYLKSEF